MLLLPCLLDAHILCPLHCMYLCTCIIACFFWTQRNRSTTCRLFRQLVSRLRVLLCPTLGTQCLQCLFSCTTLQELYTHKAKELEAEGKFREAEKMYCTIKQYDLAINLYKQHSMWDHVMRLVSQHRKVCLSALLFLLLFHPSCASLPSSSLLPLALPSASSRCHQSLLCIGVSLFTVAWHRLHDVCNSLHRNVLVMVTNNMLGMAVTVNPDKSVCCVVYVLIVLTFAEPT